MFVKKLVEKAAKKPGGSSSEGLRANDVEPRVVFHYGIPAGAHSFAYDPIQKILAVSTRDGRIKLFGKDHCQALLVSEETAPSRFLEFVQNQGILLNANSKNQIEVWDIDKKFLSRVHAFNGVITSFRVMQQTSYFYVGDSSGNVSVLKLEQGFGQVLRMDYTIPYLASNGSPIEAPDDAAVVNILPQPTAESKRILLVFRSGLIVLWDIRESKPILKTGGHGIQSVQHQEVKKATCACWVCPFGGKAVVGYSNGDITLWSVPSKAECSSSESGIQASMICKLNLGYKSEKIPIASMKWVYAEGKASRLNVMGSSSNLLQVVLLNEHTETRTIKLGLHASEPCADMEIVTDVNEQSKHRQEYLLVRGKSGHVYAYDGLMIEKYLLQSQSKAPPSIPKEITIKMPFADSSITAAKFLTNPLHMLNPSDEDYVQLAKDVASLLPFQTVPKEGTRSSSAHFPGFTKVKNVLITGHSDGTINIWDMTCPFLIPVLSLKQQIEHDTSSRGTALTALHYDSNGRLLVSGDQNGMVHIYKFKPEPFVTESSLIPFQGSTKKGNSHIIQSIKHIKVNGTVICLSTSESSRHLAVGSDQGHVALVDMEEPTLLYQKHIASEICPGIISLQFETCSVRGFEKNVLVVAMRDSSILALDSDSGNMIGTNTIRPKKPLKALFMQILDGKNDPSSQGLDLVRENQVEDIMPKQASVLLCCEKAVYIFSLAHVLQGVKKVLHKKKFSSSSCCWASTFYGASGVGLLLVLADGTVEIRSLPELSLLKQTSIRGFAYSLPKPNSIPETTISSSLDGDLIMVNGDQELVVASLLPQKNTFRFLDSISEVYRKDMVVCQEDSMQGIAATKEKKKGIFGSVFGSKAKSTPDIEIEDTKESIEELSKIFSTANFPWNNESTENPGMAEDEIELDIDDIDLEDHGQQPPREQGKLPGLNKQKLANKFHSFKGKLKQMKGKNEKSVSKEEKQEEKGSAVDQIKKRYGFSSSGETSAAKMAESKLQENLKKLQGISLRTTQMEDTAKSFSSTAKELLDVVEQNKQSSKQ